MSASVPPAAAPVAAAAAAAGSAAGDAAALDPDAQRRVRKQAAAEAAAKARLEYLVAGARGRPFGELHSSEQVATLTDAELWDTLAVQWAKPGAETIQAFADTWEGPDLAAMVHRLGLPVLYAKRNYEVHMRRSIVEAVLRYAREHPELFGAPGDATTADEEEASDLSVSEEEKEPAVRPASIAAPPPAQRRPPSQRAAAAHNRALTAAQALPQVAASPSRQSPARRRARPPMAPVVARRAPLRVDLFNAGAGHAPLPSPGESEGDDGSSDGDDGGDDPLDYAIRRGGHMRASDMDHALRAACVPTDSFAAGFVANARKSGGGVSMFQLYKEDHAAALELTCRRLGGVHTAAETGNWAMCERFELEAQQRSFVPDACMRSALKSVVQMAAVKKSAAESGAGRAPRSRGAAAGQKDRPRATSRPRNKKEAWGKDAGSGAATSHKKAKSGSDQQ